MLPTHMPRLPQFPCGQGGLGPSPGGQGPCRDGGELLKEVTFHGACFSLEGASQPFSDLENSKNVLGCLGCLCPVDSWISREDVRIRVLFP